jgi:hypothetical protein
MNFKNIHIGQVIKERVLESEIEIFRICKFLKCSEDDIKKMYDKESIEANLILRWSKILEYDFFRIYTQHLILYAPQGNSNYNKINKKITLPQFRKNIYTKEVIFFLLEMINTGEKTKVEIIEQYKIPKTTLYKWISKYK